MKASTLILVTAFALPLMAQAEEAAKAEKKQEAAAEHKMQNSNPSATPAPAALEHAMKNSNPNAVPAATEAPKHTMQNK